MLFDSNNLIIVTLNYELGVPVDYIDLLGIATDELDGGEGGTRTRTPCGT